MGEREAGDERGEEEEGEGGWSSRAKLSKGKPRNNRKKKKKNMSSESSSYPSGSSSASALTSSPELLLWSWSLCKGVTLSLGAAAAISLLGLKLTQPKKRTDVIAFMHPVAKVSPSPPPKDAYKQTSSSTSPHSCFVSFFLFDYYIIIVRSLL